MKTKTGKRSRSRAPWKPTAYVALRNVSGEHLVLHLPSGRQRIDVGQRLFVPPEITHNPEVQQYIQDGKLAIDNGR